MPDRSASRPLRVLCAAAAAALVAVSAAAARGPVAVDRMPATIPAGGVNVTGVIVLTPPLAATGLISSSKAVALAHRSADPHVWRLAHVLRATIPGPVAVAPDGAHGSWATLRNEPAWIVTFTASRPQSAGAGPGVVTDVTHMAVVLDARTGRFVRGFTTG